MAWGGGGSFGGVGGAFGGGSGQTHTSARGAGLLTTPF